MSTSSEALKEILEQMPHGRKISKELDELGNMTLVSEHIEENCWRCKLTGALAKEASSEAGLSEVEQKILLLQRKEFDTLGDGYVRLSAVLAIVRQVATREQTALAKEARDAAKETGDD